MDLNLLDIRELGGMYRRRELSPVEAVDACLSRIDRCEKQLNAWITILREEARAEAIEAERALGRGEDRGPLHGVPIAIKDNIDVAGTPTTCAALILRDAPAATVDALAVKRLRQAGAIVLGKTNLLEFAYGIVHPAFGQCNNPWNLGRTSGGSSSGSGAAVSAGMAYAGVGTDTGGSIRIPAAYCGVAGLKPTYERISRQGVFPLSESLDHVGPIARTVNDVRLVLQALDGTGYTRPVQAIDLNGRRVGVVPEHMGDDLRAGVRAEFERARQKLVDAGAHLVEVSVHSLHEADDALLDVIAPEAALVHEEWMRTRLDDYAPLTREQLKIGTRTSGLAYLRAQRVRERIRAEFAMAFEQVEVVISPTVAWVAPAEDPAVAGEEGAIEARRSGPYNLSGLPAITVPSGLGEDGLPVGLQISAPWNADYELLDFAAAFERISDWRRVCPPAIAALIGGST